MKKVFIIIILFCSQFAYSQFGWFPQNSNSLESLSDIYMIDSLNGWIVSVQDSILHTTNGGVNWIKSSNGYEGFLSVFFLDINTGWMTGVNIIKTTDGGNTWVNQLSSAVGISDIYFINGNTGWAVGHFGFYRYTTNGGLNWIEGNIVSSSLLCIYFINDNTGWIGGDNGTILKTTNQGHNWIPQNTGTDIRFYSIRFTTPDSGWASGFYPGPGKIYRSTDGGNTWAHQYTTSVALTENFFINSSKGWVVGNFGRILHTSNSGINWYQQASGVSSIFLESVFFTSEFTGWVVGGNGTILKTTTGGIVGMNTNNNEKPDDFRVFQNYPNPFNSTTNIKFDLPIDCYVKLSVANILGKEVAVLVNEFKRAGTYEVQWVADNFSSGVYFYSLRTEKFFQTNKLILIK